MSQSNEAENGQGAESSGAEDRDRSTSGQSSQVAGVGNRIATWFAASILRVGVAIVGFVILLVALGEIVGMNLLDLTVEALSSGVGRWIAVAVFALLLIALALRGFGVTTT